MQVQDWCQENKIGLVAVGPEQPLVDGLADALEKAGIRLKWHTAAVQVSLLSMNMSHAARSSKMPDHALMMLQGLWSKR